MGSIYWRTDVAPLRCCISFHYQGKNHIISRDGFGQFMYAEKVAERRLHEIQTTHERAQRGECVFRIEQFTANGFTDVIECFEAWLELKKKKKKATYRGYRSYFDCHFKPYFTEHPIMMHEIQLDILYQLLSSLKSVKFNKQTKERLRLSGKMKYNIMNCFHSFMDYAYRAKRIPEMPPFPKKEDYELQEPTVKWLSEERQMRIIGFIPEIHRPIFLWLKYHYRRPAEACALHKTDYDEINQVFIVRRSISARTLVDSTKTETEHYIPCDDEFISIVKKLIRANGSPFLFLNPRARKDGKRYTNESLNTIWHDACKLAGENIDLYSGLKHSACSQFINEKGGTDSELQMLTDHARLDSVKKYRKLEVSRKRELMRRRATTPKLHRVDFQGTDNE